METIRDDSAKQVLAFREQADILANETRQSEENAIQLKGQLRKTKGLLSDAVRTIETLKDELQTDDYKRNSDYEEKNIQMNQMEQRLSETLITLKATEARYQIQQQEAKRTLESKDRLARKYKETKTELDVVRKQYDETRRNLLHLQRCARNASVIEKNCARFLRDANKATSSNGSSSARGKLNGNGGEMGGDNAGGNGGLPEIGSPRVTDTTASNIRRSNKRQSKKNSKLGLRPGSAPLRRRDQNEL